MAFYERDVDVMIDSAKLQARIAELGQQITREYQGKDLTLIGIMKGSVFFLTDLAKAIDLPVTMELMGVSSYHGGTETTGEVRISFDVTKPLNGKHVLIVEDIIDTGLTMKFLLENFAARHPASVKVCTLLEKPARAKTKVPIDFKGFVIEDKFVVGYGLDYGEKYRNLPFIGVMRTE
ncbi:MAG: hypoxanthine phosphoribosyltransferase [Archangium sp.]|nr:hypoxanthine phosphoribosyltransferase [Archangium sp.]